MSIPENWQNYAKSKVNEILQEVKDSSGLKAPIPISEVIESYIGDVHYVVSMDDDFPEGVSAFSKKYMDIGWMVVINGRETIERQRFSSAHELAHIALFKTNPEKVFCSADNKSWDEKLCDQFAGDILMPEEMVRDLYKSNPSLQLEDIAKFFKVSLQVAEIQMKRLGLPFINLAANGF